MNWQSGIPDKSWDKTLFAEGGHYLQSSYWATFQAALGKRLFYASGKGWQALAILEVSRFATRLYCPYGPLAKSKQALSEALKAIKQLARQQNAVFVRMEPVVKLKEKELHALRLHPALKDIQQRLTWIQDLTKTPDELMADMTATNRNLYRTFAKKGLTIRQSHMPTDMKFFVDMMHEVAANTGIKPHSDRYYQVMADMLLPLDAAKVYVAEHQGKPVASAFVLDSPTTRYYVHAASYSAARKLHPGSPLISQMMLDAKKNGQKEFDFCGVAPPDAPPTHRWAGFTKFKQSFGGEYKAYNGTWELAVNLPLYALYRNLYKTAKLLRRKH